MSGRPHYRAVAAVAQEPADPLRSQSPPLPRPARTSASTASLLSDDGDGDLGHQRSPMAQKRTHPYSPIAARSRAGDHDDADTESARSLLSQDDLDDLELEIDDRPEAPFLHRNEDQPSLAHIHDPRQRGGILNSFFNMANSIIGAGIIGLPFAFSCTGWATGIFLLLSLTVVVDWTIRLIVVNAKLTGKTSYQDTVESCFGFNGLVAVSLAQGLFAFGGMVSFCVIIGDTIPDVFATLFPKIQHRPFLWLFTNRQFIITLCTTCISYPLSLHRDISNLAKASALALLSMCLIIFTVISRGPFVPHEVRGKTAAQAFIFNWNSLKAISVISFAFVCHHNSLLIYGSLNRPTLDRFATVTHISTGVSCVACLVMALTGYLVFTSSTRGNILNNFPRDNGDMLVMLARFCFGFNCFTTLPIEAFVCREVVVNCFYAPRIPNRAFSTKHHVAVTSAFVFGAMLISLFVHDLGIVLDLTGGTSACALAYILPPLCYLHSLQRSKQGNGLAELGDGNGDGNGSDNDIGGDSGIRGGAIGLRGTIERIREAGGDFDRRQFAAGACTVFGLVIMAASIVKVFVA